MGPFFLFQLPTTLKKMSLISTHSQAQMAYEPTLWAKIFHSAPHVNITFHHVDPTFNPENDLYLESLGILASVPAGNHISNAISRLRECTTKKSILSMKRRSEVQKSIVHASCSLNCYLIVSWHSFPVIL